MSDFILYTAGDGQTAIRLRVEENSVWLSQAEIAELFQTTKQNVSLHIKNILDEKELSEAATVKNYLTVQNEGGRQISRSVLLYRLEMILAVGYRVRGPRGTQFRQWATRHLSEYLIKGFVMDDERLKEPGDWDYFDELLERIRRIRASEKRFYQKVRDLYATAVDYDAKADSAQLFFKKVQNKMLWAVTGHTAAEIIAARSDANRANMGLTSFRGSLVRKQDVAIAKNYLHESEMTELDRIVTMYLDYAEDRARNRRQTTMAEWEARLDAFLEFNERDLLKHAGKVKAEVAEQLALERYEEFESKRRLAERVADDQQDLREIEALEQRIAPPEERK